MYIAVVVVLVPFLSLSCDTRVVRERLTFMEPPLQEREKSKKECIYFVRQDRGCK
jgi:hypothetical protein